MEEWRNVIGYENLYMVSDYGNVKSLQRTRKSKCNSFSTHSEIILKPSYIDGYKQVKLYVNNSPKTIKVHRLVCLAFLENPENKPDVNHKNGIRDDNRLANLEWCTHQENMIHAIRTGLKIPKYGDNIHCCKISDSDAVKILERIKSGEVGRRIAKEFNVAATTISNLKNRTHIKNLIKDQQWR